MAKDARIELAKQMMGARLRKIREEAGIGVSELARRADADRSYVHDIEAGRANPTIELYAKLLSLCGVDFDEFLIGFKPSEVAPQHQEFYRMLAVILNSGVSDQVQGIRASLEAFSEKASRLQRARGDPPSPKAREGSEPVVEAKGVGSRVTKKHKNG